MNIIFFIFLTIKSLTTPVSEVQAHAQEYDGLHARTPIGTEFSLLEEAQERPST